MTILESINKIFDGFPLENYLKLYLNKLKQPSMSYINIVEYLKDYVNKADFSKVKLLSEEDLLSKENLINVIKLIDFVMAVKIEKLTLKERS